VLDDLAGEELSEDLDLLVDPVASAFEGPAQHVELVLHPACADAEHDAVLRVHGGRAEGLRDLDRMAQGKDVDVGREAQARRVLREDGHRQEGVGKRRVAAEVGIARGAVRVLRFSLDRNEDVVGEEQAGEPHLLGDAGDLDLFVGMGVAEGLPVLDAGHARRRPRRRSGSCATALAGDDREKR
jgi:hypothetical protein